MNLEEKKVLVMTLKEVDREFVVLIVYKTVNVMRRDLHEST